MGRAQVARCKWCGMRRRRKWRFIAIACVCTLLLAAVVLHLAREASEVMGLPTHHHSLPEPVRLANCLIHSGWRASNEMGKLTQNTEDLRNTVSFHLHLPPCKHRA